MITFETVPIELIQDIATTLLQARPVGASVGERLCAPFESKWLSLAEGLTLPGLALEYYALDEEEIMEYESEQRKEKLERAAVWVRANRRSVRALACVSKSLADGCKPALASLTEIIIFKRNGLLQARCDADTLKTAKAVGILGDGWSDAWTGPVPILPSSRSSLRDVLRQSSVLRSLSLDLNASRYFENIINALPETYDQLHELSFVLARPSVVARCLSRCHKLDTLHVWVHDTSIAQDIATLVIGIFASKTLLDLSITALRPYTVLQSCFDPHLRGALRQASHGLRLVRLNLDVDDVISQSVGFQWIKRVSDTLEWLSFRAAGEHTWQVVPNNSSRPQNTQSFPQLRYLRFEDWTSGLGSWASPTPWLGETAPLAEILRSSPPHLEYIYVGNSDVMFPFGGAVHAFRTNLRALKELQQVDLECSHLPHSEWKFEGLRATLLAMGVSCDNWHLSECDDEDGWEDVEDSESLWSADSNSTSSGSESNTAREALEA